MIKIKLNYFIIPLFVLAAAWLGGWLTSSGIANGWYNTINKPTWTPPGSIIGAIWTIIFILSAISAVLVWNSSHNSRFVWIITFFIINAVLNIFWSFLFFNQHLIFAAALEAILLELSVFALIILIWPISIMAAALLLPYAGWVIFATYLTFYISALNK